jgi:hypothetical protein
LIEKAKGNEYITMPDPKSKSGQLTFIAEVFGYRKIQHEINYKIPLADTVKSYIDLVGTTFVINFDMVRYRAGDIATLYQVYFYNDAAIMLPESKYQLEELRALMNENPKYRIRLHGLRDGHLAPAEQRRMVARLAAEAPVCALREALVGLGHEVARHAELVVVLDVVVRPERVEASDPDGRRDGDADQRERGHGQRAEPGKKASRRGRVLLRHRLRMAHASGEGKERRATRPPSP